MTDVAIKTAPAPFSTGAAVREQLRRLDDSGVVSAFLQGEERAFQELVERYQTRLLNFIYRTIGDRERAEDLVQEVFIRVYRHLHRFDRSKKFSTWIYTIAGNLARNDLRRRRRSPFVAWAGHGDSRFAIDQTDSALDPRPRPDDEEVTRSTMELIERQIARLAPIHRQVFVLRELEGRTYEEIAVIVECDLGTVKSRLNRARRAFARLIAPYLD